MTQGFRDQTLIAKPRAGVTASQIAARESVEGVQLRRDFPRLGNLRVLDLPSGSDAMREMEKLKASGLYEYVEPNYVLHRHAAPNDPRFAEQWYMRNTGQDSGKSGADIGAVAGWDTRTAAGDVIIAVIDTGVRLTHEDLAANLWTNAGEIPGNGIDDDGDGYIDDVHGINAVAGKSSSQGGNPDDDQGHGTSVASLVAAAGNNGKGIAGVAWQAKVMALKVDDAATGGADTAKVVECIDYAVSKGAKVINISYGSSSNSTAEYDALKRARDAGVVVVASAGNDGVSAELVKEYPADYLLDNLVAVANTDRNDQLSVSSSYGNIVELAAPGTDILTASNHSDTEYRTVSGTSFSSPIVAGSVALLRAQFPQDTYRQSINRLLGSVDSLSNLSGLVQTGGRLNLAKALTSTTNRPFNDDFAKRAVLSGSGLTLRSSNVGATAEAGEPAVGSQPASATVWWSWTAPTGGVVILDTAGSSFDTVLGVYTGSAGALTAVASNDDAVNRTTSHVSFAARAGSTYHFCVDGKSGATGAIVLSLGIVPGNDDFAQATSLVGMNATATGSIVQASKENGEPTLKYSTYTGSGQTVWYRWTATKTGSFSVTVQTDSFSPIIAVYTGSTVDTLKVLDTYLYSVSFDAVEGSTYSIAIDSFDGSAGQFSLQLMDAIFAWRMPDAVNSSPLFPPDNAIIAMDNSGYLIHLSNTTAESWQLPVKGNADVNTPAVGSDGTTYASTSAGLFAFSKTGTLKWEKSLTGDDGSSPAIAADGTVYQHSGDGKLHAYLADGTERWQASVPGVSYSSPSIAADGTIYIGSDDNYLYAISPTDGSIRWRFNTGGQVYASPAIGSDGAVYIGSLGGKFFCVEPTGGQRWAFTAGGSISSSAALATDGTVYFGCYDKKMYALTSAGIQKWTFATENEIRASSPAVDVGGLVYIGSSDGRLYTISSAGLKVSNRLTGGQIRSSVLLGGDAALFGSGDRFLYAVPASALANSPWPQFRQNASRTGRVAVKTAPTIVTQPVSRSVAIGGSVTLTVNTNGQSPLAFQWYLNGVAIAGATQPTYTITNATNASAGNYTVVVTNALGSVTSSVATVSVATASDIGRLVNLSARAVAGSDSKTLIVGLIISGSSDQKPIIIRGVGPTLSATPYNVPGALSDPALTLFNGGGVVIGSNDNWGSDPLVGPAMARAGAFDFVSPTSKDAAISTSLAPGAYTAHVNTSSGSGVALAEFYDATEVYTTDSPRLTNLSARADVGTGANILIVGFVIGGQTPRTVLIRGIGPTLGNAPYNVSGVLADPKLELFSGQTVIQSNDNWGSAPNAGEILSTMNKVNAFALASNSKDAVIIATLQPGSYTAQVSGVGNTTGVALAEVYLVE